MKRKAETRNERKRRTLTLGCAALLAALLLTPSTLAGHKHKRKHVKHATYCTVQGCVVEHARRPVVVPRRVKRHQAHIYRPYFGGTAYFRPHGHDHDVYYFPVRTGRGVVYRPHYYCRGSLSDRNHIAYHGEHVSFRVGF